MVRSPLGGRENDTAGGTGHPTPPERGVRFASINPTHGDRADSWPKGVRELPCLMDTHPPPYPARAGDLAAWQPVSPFNQSAVSPDSNLPLFL